jgi:hypothetical protein
MTRDDDVRHRSRRAFFIAGPRDSTWEEGLLAVDSLAAAFRTACGNLGLTYQEALNALSKAWGPGRITSYPTLPLEPPSKK